jgi:hypothetical protein
LRAFQQSPDSKGAFTDKLLGLLKSYMNSTNPSDWGSWTYAAEIAGAGEVLQPTPDDLEGLLYIPQFTSYSYAPKGLVLELGSDTPANSTSAMPERLCNVGQKAKEYFRRFTGFLKRRKLK